MIRHRKIGSLLGGAASSLTTYDTAIGQGVGTDGFASLPLRAGAKYIYVNSSTGSDSNSGLTNALPVATFVKALSLATVGAGDQILVAQGTTYASGIPDWRNITTPVSGFSAQYPIVMQSYDSTDPTNTAKYGRATGSNRPVITQSGTQTFMNGHGGMYIAFRGLDFNPGNVASANINAIAGTGGNTGGYLLFENCRFQYVLVGAQGQNGQVFYKVIFRNCSAHGQWDPTGDQQWVYTQLVDGLTIEDCSMIHVGWNEAVARNAAASSGGATQFSHCVYSQDDCKNNVMRRCVIVNAATDGGRLKSGGLYQNNLVINCPIAVDNGGGNTYTINSPFGVYHDISGNVAFGSGKIDGSAGSLWGWHISGNGVVGSAVHHNITARSVDGNASWAFGIDAPNDTVAVGDALPSYGNFYSNVSYLWNASGNSKGIGTSGTTGGAASPLLTSLFNTNVWDDPTGGTNTNNGSVTLPNSYTLTALLAATNAAYVDLPTAQTDWQNNPDNRGWRNAITLAQAGYGVAPGLQDLVTTLSLTVGVPSFGLFVGTLDGSTLSSSTLPSGVTLDSDCRVWRYDGTGTAGSGTTSITETNGGNSHTTSLSWVRYAQPVLSSLSVTPTYNSATASVSANVGSGKLYWIVSNSSTSPDWRFLRDGINADFSAPVKSGSQAIAASGTQNIASITGLASTTSYYLYVAQLDANGNPSVTSTYNFTTSAAPAATLSSPSASPQATTEIIRVTTDTGGGTMYAVVTTSSTAPTAAQIIAGQNNLGTAAVFAANKAVTASGIVSFLATGLTASTSYYIYFVQATSSNSNVAATGLSATIAADTGTWSAGNSNASWTLGGTTSAATATQSGTSWTEAYGSVAKTTGVWTVVKNNSASANGEFIGFSKTGIGNGNYPPGDTGSVWWRGDGSVYVGGTLVTTTSQPWDTTHATTLVNDNGYISLYFNGVIYVDRLNCTAVGTSFVPAVAANFAGVQRTADFTNY